MFRHSPNPLCLISVLSPSAKTTTLLTSVRGIQFSQVVNLPSMEPHSLSPPTLDTLHAVRPSPSYLHCSTHPPYAQANSFIYPVKGHMGYFHTGALTNDLDVNVIVHIYCCKDRHLSSGYWIHFLLLLQKITTECSALNITYLLSFSSGGQKSGVDLTRLKSRCQQDFFYGGSGWGPIILLIRAVSWVQFLAAGGQRSPFSCWLSAESFPASRRLCLPCIMTLHLQNPQQWLLTLLLYVSVRQLSLTTTVEKVSAFKNWHD